MRTTMLLAAGLLAAPAPLSAQAAPERFELRHDHVAVYNLAGEAVLEAGSGGSVIVAVTRQGPDAADLRVTTGQVDGRLTLRVLYPDGDIHYDPPGRSGFQTDVRVRDDGTFGDGHWTRGDRRRGRRIRVSDRHGDVEAHANLRIAIPDGQQIALYVGAGPVTVRNVNGQLRVEGAATAVTASGTRGALEIDVGSGSVELTDAEGNVNIDTGSGGVTVRNVRGDDLIVDTGSGGVEVSGATVRRLDVDTGSGSVRISSASADQVRIDTGSGSVRATLAGRLDDIEVDTGSGSVTLNLPADYGATVDLETGSGGIDLQFPVEVRRIQRDRVRGTVGDGTGRLTVDTGSGTIEIRRS